jgi:hypothetical protein
MTKSSEKRSLPAGLRPFWPVMRLLQRVGSAEKVARTSIYLASAPEAANFNGQYFESSTHPKQLSAEIIDITKQEKTWELGLSLVQNAQTAISYEPEPVF